MKVALRRAVTVLLILFVLIHLTTQGIGLITLTNPVFIASIIGLILLLGLNRKLW